MRKLAIILAIMAVVSTPVAAVVYVKADCTGPVFDGNSWQTAYPTIQQGLNDAAVGGEEVWVARGLYPENPQLKTGVALKGGYAGIGDQRNIKTYVTTIRSFGNALVTGADGAAIDGFTLIGGYYGIDCEHTSPTVTNNTILSCVQAVWLYYSNAVVTHNTIRGCSYNAVYCQYGSPMVANNVIVGNGSCGVVCGDGSSPTVANNTIAVNGSCGILCFNTHPVVVNNIVACNVMGIYDEPYTGWVNLHHNCLWDNGENLYALAQQPTDVVADPQFMSLRGGDFHLKPTSPCVNAGQNQTGATVDMDGQPRVNGSAVDMGADESYGELYDVPVRTLYVNQASRGGDGSSWSKAFTAIDDATQDVVYNGPAEIWVAKGTYQGEFYAESFSYIYGGFAGSETQRSQRQYRANPTIIDASWDGDWEAIESGGLVTIDGFTICGGTDGVYVCAYAPNISNNILTGNSRSGVYVTYSGGTSVVAGNLVTENGQYGVYVHCARAAVTNNTIVHNPSGIYWEQEGEIGVASNNIVAFNDLGLESSNQAPSLVSNCFHNTTNYPSFVSHPTDITDDPIFADRNSDFHIRSNSPCRNRADARAQGIPATDFDGQNRIEGNNLDIGADESYGEQYPPEVVRVKWDSPNDGPGNDWDHAWRTIAEAQVGLSPFDEIWVAQGQYNEKPVLQSGTVLRGGYSGVGDQRSISQYPTIIDGGGGSATIVTAGENTIVDGFTIRHGGRGVSATASMNVINNTITACSSYGVYSSGSSTYIHITNNRIFGNATGVQCSAGWAYVVNNTIADNSSVGVFTINGDTANNIIAFNQYGFYCPVTPNLVHNDIYGNVLGDYKRAVSHPTDICLDPKFVSRTLGDYHLIFGSPCIDSASPLYLPASDLEGAPRPCDGNLDGTAIGDLGCYELLPSPVSAAIGAVKSMQNGQYVSISGAVSTAVFGDRFYVETPNRACGIAVMGTAPSTGSIMTVEGLLDIVGGERVIRSTRVVSGSTAPIPAPLLLNCNAIGGGPVGLQAAVQDYRNAPMNGIWQRSSDPIAYGGANNIGLLVKVVGKVASTGSGFFYLYDGSPFDDGDSATKGVRVDWPFTDAMPAGDSVIELTAISSCTTKTVGGKTIVVRLLRPVSAASWKELRAP